jgi:hypothetical protein
MAKEAEFSFGIKTPEDLLIKLREEIRTLLREPDSAYAAINAAFTAWHLSEWVWGLQLKNQYTEQSRLFNRVFRGQEEFETYILEFEFFRVVREVCNGSKHLGSSIGVSEVAATGMTEEKRARLMGSDEVAIMRPHPIVTLANGEVRIFRTFLEMAYMFWLPIITGRTSESWNLGTVRGT